MESACIQYFFSPDICVLERLVEHDAVFIDRPEYKWMEKAVLITESMAQKIPRKRALIIRQSSIHSLCVLLRHCKKNAVK